MNTEVALAALFRPHRGQLGANMQVALGGRGRQSPSDGMSRELVIDGQTLPTSAASGRSSDGDLGLFRMVSTSCQVAFTSVSMAINAAELSAAFIASTTAAWAGAAVLGPPGTCTVTRRLAMSAS